MWQTEEYMAVRVTRDGGTPEWFVSTHHPRGLMAVSPDQAEDIAVGVLDVERTSQVADCRCDIGMCEEHR